MASEIKVDFKKYLPSSMRDTRWGEWIEAFQDLTSDFKQEKIDILIDRFNSDLMTDEHFQTLCSKFGWNLSVYEGWSNQSDYFKRQFLTLTDRILFKTTRRAYLDEFYIYNLYGDVFPLIEQDDGTLLPYETWQEFSELPNVVNILDSADDNILYYQYYTVDGQFKIDQEQTSDMYFNIYDNIQESGLNEAWLDTPSTIRTLDEESILDYMKRQFIIQYTYNLVENNNEYLSSNSMLAFWNDVKQIKRKTEKIYFEPKLKINYTNDSSIQTTQYEDFDRNEDIASMQTICASSDLFNEAFNIQIGNGSHDTLNFSLISGVSSPTATLTSGNLIKELNEDTWYIRKAINENDTFEDFSEIALVYSGTCFLYSTFPTVRYPDTYGNVSFEFTDLNYVP